LSLYTQSPSVRPGGFTWQAMLINSHQSRGDILKEILMQAHLRVAGGVATGSSCVASPRRGWQVCRLAQANRAYEEHLPFNSIGLARRPTRGRHATTAARDRRERLEAAHRGRIDEKSDSSTRCMSLAMQQCIPNDQSAEYLRSAVSIASRECACEARRNRSPRVACIVAASYDALSRFNRCKA